MTHTEHTQTVARRTMFADGRPSLTIEDAYQLQIETARLRRMRGETIAGYKIGCVSQVVQRQLGVTQAVFGHVFKSEIRPKRARIIIGELAAGKVLQLSRSHLAISTEDHS